MTIRCPPGRKLSAPVKAGVEFTETMKGYFSSAVKTATPPLQLDPSYQQGFDQGATGNSPFQFTLTIVSEDLDDMTSNPAHQARNGGDGVGAYPIAAAAHHYGRDLQPLHGGRE